MEPLARTLSMQAQKRGRRSTSMPVVGMRKTIQPMDSLDSQAMMDDAQLSVVNPPGSAAMAILPGQEEPRSPAAVMTAQFRKDGGAPVQQTQCPGGRCPVGPAPGVQSMSNHNIPLSPGERIIAIDGVPVNGAGPVPSMPAPTAYAAPQPQATFDPKSPEDMIRASSEMLQRARNNFPGPSAGVANDSVIGRTLFNHALSMPQKEKEMELLSSLAEQARKHSEAEIEAHKSNLEARAEATYDGMLRQTDSMLRGEGKYEGIPADLRARAAATHAQRFMTAASNGQSGADQPTFDKLYDKFHGMAVANDVSDVIASHGTMTPQGYEYQKGTKPILDQQIASRYAGVTDTGKPDGKVLWGESLRQKMHSELTAPLARKLSARAIANTPVMSQEYADHIALREAHDTVNDLFETVNGYNQRMAGQSQFSWGNPHSYFRLLDFKTPAAGALDTKAFTGPMSEETK